MQYILLKSNLMKKPKFEMDAAADQKAYVKTGLFAMRFDPRVKYLAELAARRERRSLTNFVEWAIDQELSRVVLRQAIGKDPEVVAADSSDLLWDLDEVERLRKLQANCPDLLNYEEQRTLALISEFGTGDNHSIRFKVDNKIEWSLVKSCWPEIKAYVSGKCREQDLVAAIRAKSK